MEIKYLEIFEKLDPEGLLDARFSATGNEYLFWLSIAMFIASANCCYQISIRNALFDAAKTEIKGLVFVGYMNKSHFRILKERAEIEIR